MATKPTRHIALLRAVNVGKRQVSMPRLRELLADDLGYEDVATYVQSGNVVFTAAKGARTVAKELSAALEAEFGFAVECIMRTRDELAQVIADDPYAKQRDDASRHLVGFSATKLDPAPFESALADRDLGEEQWTIIGRELHAYLPGGFGRSPLLQALGKGGKSSPNLLYTGRNWRSVLKLLDLADAAP